MALIKLLIFDDDDEYSSNLCKFLTHHYSETLLVNYYNNSYKIEEWIKKIDPDIILASENYYSQICNQFKKNLIILTTGTNSAYLADVPSINKYQDANQIAGSVINFFTKSSNIIENKSDKSAKIVAVYSAAGNTGKTSLATGISAICSYSGLSVFYLNLEQFPSTGVFLSDSSEYSITDIIYYAKEQDKNLISKITTMSCKDIASNVHYFKEANNLFEINEILPQDIELILNAMKSSGQYDLIVIDMDSQLNDNTISIFNMADEILYIFTNEEICLHKTMLFIENMKILSNRTFHSTLFAHKTHYVANKVSKQALQSFNSLPDVNIISKIPLDLSFNSAKNLFKINGGPEIIKNSLKEIARRYIK
jgi:cellulose biosynthesis protein BcsQ